jgi:sulfite reductase alpha subunit-like flavoprotein
MSNSRSLLVLFGSQSGNAEDVASQVGKAASKYGLEAIVKGMDEIQISDLVGQKKNNDLL